MVAIVTGLYGEPMLDHRYTYHSVLETSQRITWRIEDVIGGRTFDFTRPFLPEALAGVEAIRCLTATEKLTLNHIRGFSYLYLFGLIEEYILPSVIEHAGTAVHGDDHEIRALLGFADEEAKHIQLFKWFVAEFQRTFPTACAGIGPAKEIAAAILNHSRLGVFLTTLHVEWVTQKHYVESVKGDQRIDPLFARLLEYHWIEESQHAKLDTLIVDKIATGLDAARIDAAVEDYMKIGELIDGGLMAQVDLDLAALERAIARTLSDPEKAEIRTAQQAAYRQTFLLWGMTHPSFDKSLRELSARGHARVAEMAGSLRAS